MDTHLHVDVTAAANSAGIAQSRYRARSGIGLPPKLQRGHYGLLLEVFNPRMIGLNKSPAGRAPRRFVNGETKMAKEIVTTEARPSKIRGFVLDKKLGQPLPGVPVALWEEADNNLFRPLAVLLTDRAGYVSFDAQGAQRDPQSFRLRSPLFEKEHSIYPASINPTGPSFVVFADAPAGAAMGHNAVGSVQNPDLQDLAASPQSFGDNGSSATATECGAPAPAQAASRDVLFMRVVLDSCSDNLDWPERPTGMKVDGTTSLAEETSLPTAKLVMLHQQWRYVGRTLGDIIYSLPLAPGETVQLATIEWSRSDSISRADQTASAEFLSHDLTRDRTITDTVQAAVKESQSGYSIMGGTATSSSAGAAIDFSKLGGESSFPLNIDAGVSGLISAAGSVSNSSGKRDIQADATQTLHDHVNQASWVTRSLNSTVVVQASQAESNTVQTRAVTNNNRCHTLTVQYYEVLRTFLVSTFSDDVEAAVLVPYENIAFTPQAVITHRIALQLTLLLPELKPAFEALARSTLTPELYKESKPPAPKKEPVFAEGSHDLEVDPRGVRHTQLEIQKGSKVKLTATGTITIGQILGDNEFSPDGKDEEAEAAYPAVGKRKYSLVCRIGNAWYQGGVSKEFVAGEEGQLLLQANDTKLDDNDGKWEVTVDVTKPAPASPQPQPEDPTANSFSKVQDEALGKLLVRHISDNATFYTRAVWALMDPAQRRELLEKYLKENRTLLACLLDTPVVAFGNWLVFAKASSSPPEKVPVGDNRRDQFVSLPSRGLLAEAELGRCNACEKRDITRASDWPLTIPTPITGVKPGPTGQPPTIPQPSSLPAPVVAIQQAPSAPDPSALAGALTLLGQANLFRDMSGLQQVQALLHDLVNGTVSETNVALRAAAALKSIEPDNSENPKPTPAPAKRTSPSTSDPGRQVDRLDAIKYALAQGQITPDQAQNASVGVLGGEVVPASYSGGTVASLPSIVEETVLGTAGYPKRPPLVPFDEHNGSTASRRAYARMVVDDGATQHQLLEKYITDFGFDRKAPEPIRGKGVRNPYLGLEPVDMAALVAVGESMGRAPAQLLALWISEGKINHDTLLHGAPIDSGISLSVSDATKMAGRIRPWMRSVILFDAFGSDRLTAVQHVKGQDNVLLGPDAPHQARFHAGLQSMQIRRVPGIGSWTDQLRKDSEAYFTETGGAFDVTASTSASGDVDFSARLPQNSLASWLWLQNALFDVFRQEQEEWFTSTYGDSVDLTVQPWVTYTYWNGGPNTRPWFTGAASSQAAIDKLFGSPTSKPTKLTKQQLDAYYSRGAYSGNQQSTAALANAAMVKYLVEATSPWFT